VEEATRVTSEPTRRQRPGSGFRVVWITVVTFAVVAIAVLVAARDQGGGGSSTSRGAVAGTQARKLAPFGAIELSGSNIVTVQVGRPQTVLVHADRNVLSRVTTAVRSGNLIIGNEPGTLASKSRMSVEISTPSVSTLRLSGSGTISAHGIRSQHLTVVVSGSGVIEASGQVTSLNANVSGSGDAMLGELASQDATATLGGSGTIVLTATRSLNASVTGSGSILYAGDPASVSTMTPGEGVIVPIAE
jgi:hypothetical protein